MANPTRPTLTMSTMIANQMALAGRKRSKPETMALGMISALENSTPLMQMLPVLPGFAKEVNYGINGNDIPGQARLLNQESTPNEGELQIAMEQETTRIYETWEVIDYLNDKAEYKESRAAQIASRVKGLGNTISEDLFININAANPARLTGFKQRITGNNLLPALENSTVSSPLSIRQAKRAVDTTYGNNSEKFIACDYELALLFEDAAKKNLDGDIRFKKTDFGLELPHFRGVPIVALGVNSSTGDKWLKFDEPGIDNHGSTTSMYVVSTATNGAALFFRSMPRWHDRGRTNTFNKRVFAMELGLVVRDVNAVQRVHSITKERFID